MAGRSDIKAGSAYVELYVTKGKFVRGLNVAQRKLRNFAKSVSIVSAHITAAGKAMIRLASLMAIPFAIGAKVFMDFEKQMAQVSQMVEEPKKVMATFGKAIRQMSIEFGDSTKSLAKGLYDILSASIPAKKALLVLRHAAIAAKAGLTTTAVSVLGMTKVIKSFQIPAKKAGDVANWFFQIIKRGQSTFEQLAPDIGKVAITAASAGLSFDEFGAALATMTRNGAKTEDAITSIQWIMKAFLKPTDQAQELANQFGFELASTTLKTEGFLGVLKKIRTLPPDIIARIFPNIRALRGVLPALRDIAGFEKDLELLKKRAGKADEAFQKIAKTLSFAFDQIKQATLRVFGKIGEALKESIKKSGKAIKRFLKHLEEWVEKNKEVIRTIAKVTIVVGVAGVALLIFGGIIKLMSVAISAALIPLIILKALLLSVAAIIAIILSPWLTLGAAIIAVTVYLLAQSRAWKKVFGPLGNSFKKLKDIATTAFSEIKKAFETGDFSKVGRIIVTALKDAFAIAKTAIIRAFREAFVISKSVILRALIDMKAGIIDIWKKIFFRLRELAIESGFVLPILKVLHAFENAWALAFVSMGYIIDSFVLSAKTALKKVELLFAKTKNYLLFIPGGTAFGLSLGDPKKLENEIKENEKKLLEIAGRLEETGGKAFTKRETRQAKQLKSVTSLVMKTPEERGATAEREKAQRDKKIEEEKVKILREQRKQLKAIRDEYAKAEAAKEAEKARKKAVAEAERTAKEIANFILPITSLLAVGAISSPPAQIAALSVQAARTKELTDTAAAVRATTALTSLTAATSAIPGPAGIALAMATESIMGLNKYKKYKKFKAEKPKVPQVQKQLNQIQGQISTHGAFDISNLLAFKGGAVNKTEQNIEKNTKETADGVKDVSKAIKNKPRLTFR